ncbi:MAG TPA: YeeE/YedE family protein, partial [Methanoregulaceae archaeon]|nr:YeeE/YedE family protein [Methanoregulaceae archaeon]
MKFSQLHNNKKAQVVLGLCFGIVFGFLLQKGGATSYDVIMGQLLLTDFTV